MAFSVSIIIPCGPGYSRWVTEAAKSALAQGEGVDVIVVFDACPSVTLPVGVRSFTVNHRNVQMARRHGLMRSTGVAVLFLDADDLLPLDFVKCASWQLKEASEENPCVAGIYPGATYTDIATGQARGGFRNPPEWDTASFKRLCVMVVSSLTWKHALIGSWHSTSSHVQLEDHAMWMDLMRDGWVFRKGKEIILHVRTHADSLSASQASPKYAVKFDIENQPITLFMALSGRQFAWPRIRDWMQSLPSNVRIVLCDDSHDAAFSVAIRNESWGLRDVRVYASGIPDPPPMHEDRTDANTFLRVEHRVCRIYNRAIQECGTQFMWILEDDILPEKPAHEVLRLLAHGVEHHVGAVSGVYRSRYSPELVAWHSDNPRKDGGYVRAMSDEPYTAVGGFGFGCVFARTDSLRKAVLCVPPGQWFDPHFWSQLHARGETLYLANGVKCVHIEASRGLRVV